MKMMKLIALLLALALCAVTLLGAVAEEAPTAEETDAAETAAEPVLLATVNGAAVTSDMVDMYFDYLADYYGQQGYPVTQESIQAQLKMMALNAAVEETAARLKAAELGLDQPSDEDLATLTAAAQTQYDELQKLYATYYFGYAEGADEAANTDALLQAAAAMESMGYTVESLVAESLNGLWYERLTAYMVEGVSVSDADVQASFDNMVASQKAMFDGDPGMYELYSQYTTVYYKPAGFRGIRHILLKVDDTLMATYNDLTARLEEKAEAVESGDAAEGTEAAAPVTQADVDAAAEAIIASIQPTLDEIERKRSEGVSFSDLIAEYGTDPGMQVEPNKTTGYEVYVNSATYVPSFTKAAFGEEMQKVGDVSKPAISSFGVHILEYTCDVPSGAVELTAELFNTIKADLQSDAESTKVNEQMAAWVEEATIVYTDAAKPYLPEVTAE